MFMDINQNQKAVSASLRLDLAEDLYWTSQHADQRMEALRSSIVKALNSDESGALYRRISIGEDKADLGLKSFIDGIKRSNLLPKASRVKMDPTPASIYNVNNLDFQSEMTVSKKKIVKLISFCFDYVENNFADTFEKPKQENLIVSNRGVEAFIALIGDLNRHITENGDVSIASNDEFRHLRLEPFLQSFLNQIDGLDANGRQKYLDKLGQGAPTQWLRMFQYLVNKQFPEYNPEDLFDWRERQDEANQKRAQELVRRIERKIKALVIGKMETIFGDKWSYQIPEIKKKCMLAAEEENIKNHKQGRATEVEWTEMFTILNYHSIVNQNWGKKPELDEEFRTFQDEFSLSFDGGQNKADLLKWMKTLSTYRNILAHAGSKKSGLNREEVDFLEQVYGHFYPS